MNSTRAAGLPPSPSLATVAPWRCSRRCSGAAGERNGLRIARASWLVGVTVREYRELEAGTTPPDWDTYDRISELFGWPQTFTSRR
jgi:hypothetical protein